MPNFEKQHRVMLGLEIAALHAKPGVPMSMEEIAAFCDCSKQAIDGSYQKALRKIRNRMSPQLRKELKEFFK